MLLLLFLLVFYHLFRVFADADEIKLSNLLNA